MSGFSDRHAAMGAVLATLNSERTVCFFGPGLLLLNMAMRAMMSLARPQIQRQPITITTKPDR